MIYQVQDPEGKVHEIEGPDNATPDEIMRQAQNLIPANTGQPSQPDMSGSFPEARAVLGSDASLPQKAWQGLQVPAQMAQRGLEGLAEATKPTPEFTGNLPRDIAMNYPSFSASVLSKAAPTFVNRASILTGGASKLLQAAKPIGSVIGKAIAGEAENVTNAVPGSLGRAWNDASLIFGKGKAAAKPMYEAGKAELEQGANIFKDMYKPDEIIKTAQDYLAKGGKLEPAEGLIYRKAVDAVSRSRNVIKDSLQGMRDVADAAAKESENISAADATYKKALDSESLRRLVPQNKYGGSSAFKMAMMGFLTKALGPAGAGLLSPAVHGALATAGGMAERIVTNPAAALTGRALITAFVEHRIHGDNQ